MQKRGDEERTGMKTRRTLSHDALTQAMALSRAVGSLEILRPLSSRSVKRFFSGGKSNPPSLTRALLALRALSLVPTRR